MARGLFQGAARAVGRALGEEATVTVGGVAYTLTGVFDETGTREEVGVGLVDVAPQISISLADVGDGPVEAGTDTVTARGVDYLVETVTPDGLGHVRLTLSRLA